MARLLFTPSLRRHLEVSPLEVPAGTLETALAAAFRENDRLRGYLLDDQGGLRPHIAVFVDGRRVSDRSRLTDAIGEASEVYVMQALSGG